MAEYVKGSIKCPRCMAVNELDKGDAKARANKLHQ